jgi:hypothetical protein
MALHGLQINIWFKRAGDSNFTFRVWHRPNRSSVSVHCKRTAAATAAVPPCTQTNDYFLHGQMLFFMDCRRAADGQTRES